MAPPQAFGLIYGHQNLDPINVVFIFFNLFSLLVHYIFVPFTMEERDLEALIIRINYEI